MAMFGVALPSHIIHYAALIKIGHIFMAIFEVIGLRSAKLSSSSTASKLHDDAKAVSEDIGLEGSLYVHTEVPLDARLFGAAFL